MNYNEAIELVTLWDGEVSRDAWSPEFTGWRIWLEKGTLMQPTRDWPQPYYPTEEDKNATDWKWKKKK